MSVVPSCPRVLTPGAPYGMLRVKMSRTVTRPTARSTLRVTLGDADFLLVGSDDVVHSWTFESRGTPAASAVGLREDASRSAVTEARAPKRRLLEEARASERCQMGKMKCTKLILTPIGLACVDEATPELPVLREDAVDACPTATFLYANACADPSWSVVIEWAVDVLTQTGWGVEA